MSSQKGYPTQEKDDRLSAQFQTIEPVRELQHGSTVVAHQFVFEVGTDAAEAGSTSSVIVATGHSALKGDVIRLTSGALSGREVKVWEVATNSITLAETLPSAIAAAVTFQILRHKYPTVDSSGSVNVNAVIAEEALSPDGGALPAQLKVAGGYDGTNVQVLKTDAAGELQVDVLSSALPSGAATEATVATLATEASLAGLNSIVATEATLSNIDLNIGGISNCVSGSELQVDIVSSALPSGAATELTLSTLATESTVATLATESTLASIETTQTDGSQKTQIVDGSGNVIGSTGNALDVNLKSPIVVDVNLDEADDSVAVFGYDGTVNRAIKTDASGELQIDILSSALPSGAATETTLNAIKTAVELIDNTVSGNELQVDVVTSALPAGAATETTLLAIEADTTSLAGCVSGSELQVDVVSSALPSGAATSANQTNGSQKSQIVDGAGDIVDVVALNVALQATDKGLVTNTIIHGETTGGGGGYVDVKVTPSGAMVTESTLAGLDAAVLGQDTMANSFPVVIASDQTAIPVTDNGSSLTVDGTVAVSSISASLGRNVINRARNVYSSTPVNTTNYQQILASTSAAVNEVEIFDSSGETLVLATGNIGSEVDQAFVFPGGNGRIPLAIGSNVRVSIKAVSATASAGEIAINFYS